MSEPEITTKDASGQDYNIVKNKKKKKNLTKYSSFHVTVSSNQKPGTNEESHALAGQMRQLVGELYNDEDNLRGLIEFLDGNNYDSGLIDKIDTTFSVELGRDPRGGRIHSHAIMHIVHHSKIRLNVDFIRQYFIQQMDLTDVHINIDVIKTDRKLVDYIGKDSTGEPVQFESSSP
jgi:hypothetical protein